MLQDLMVGPKSQAQEMLSAMPDDSRWPRVDVKGLGITMVGALSEILKTGEWDCKPLAMREPEGPWLFEVPEVMTRAMLDLDEARFEATISEWHRDDETAANNYDRDSVGFYLSALCQGARIARQRGQTLMLWVSL